LLANPGNVNSKTDEPEIRAAADRLKHDLELLTASTESDLEAAMRRATDFMSSACGIESK
jgi:hypothetical protein